MHLTSRRLRVQGRPDFFPNLPTPEHEILPRLIDILLDKHEPQRRDTVDWKVFFSTFGLIFFAELGDKTQLTTMMLAAQSDSMLSVFVGAALALSLSALLGVVFGEAVTKLIPTHFIHTGAGIAFVGLGILLILGKF